MVVDDNPQNLKLLEGLLRQAGYQVRLFPAGRLALASAQREPPDLMLLDINMPNLNGYEVCEQMKSDPRLSAIPVIFLSALTAIEDKIKGFQSGGVDYISKPFQVEEIQARVRTHVKLRHAQLAERDLLERTLGGAVGTIWELVQLTSPALALRSRAVREIVLRLTTRLGTNDAWRCELAATLCLVGCMALPDEVFERAYRGQNLSSDDERMFHAHPETAARLLSSIPRLEVVAEIIRWQQKPKTATEEAAEGAQILHLALELDRRICRDIPPSAALAQLRLTRRFDRRMLDALEGYAPAQPDADVRRLPVRELRAGMVLEKNVVSNDGNLLILKEGTVLTETWIERLENFAKVRGAHELVEVRIAKPAGATG